MQAQDILQFWFDEAGPKKWYNGGDGFDADIRQRFEEFAIGAAAQLKQDGAHDWELEPEATLALIIALDQFSRNMYRGTAGAFAWDALALDLACRAVEKGFDLKIPQDRRAFIYMPHMHAEDVDMQDECVRLIDMRLDNESNLFHAKEHCKLIKRFGRFPHRNAILGRENTPEEKRFLDAGGYSP